MVGGSGERGAVAEGVARGGGASDTDRKISSVHRRWSCCQIKNYDTLISRAWLDVPRRYQVK